MSATPDVLARPEFPRSSRYPADWMMDHQMGPNAVWLAEWLCERLPLEPGMRVLDLGCGKAITSIFMAKELGVQVYAVDLWMSPDNNYRRAVEAGVADRVVPLHAEAHALPFAAGFFDAAVSVDAYQYFGTDELYASYLSRFVRPGGHLGIVVPGLAQPLTSGVPEHLLKPQANGKIFWEDECASFKTLEWWVKLWRRCSRLTDVEGTWLEDGWRHWRDFERAIEAAGKGIFPSDAETLDRDRGRWIGFPRVVARRSDREAPNLYDPSLGTKAGVDR